MAARLGRQSRPYGPIRLPIITGWDERSVSEEDVEKALFRSLAKDPRGPVVKRQVECCGLIPDLVIEWGHTVTVVEIKRWHIGHRAVSQATRYVEHWAAHLEERPGDWTVYGVLAAPFIRRSVVLPAWCAFQPLELDITVSRVA